MISGEHTVLLAVFCCPQPVERRADGCQGQWGGCPGCGPLLWSPCIRKNLFLSSLRAFPNTCLAKCSSGSTDFCWELEGDVWDKEPVSYPEQIGWSWGWIFATHLVPLHEEMGEDSLGKVLWHLGYIACLCVWMYQRFHFPAPSKLGSTQKLAPFLLYHGSLPHCRLLLTWYLWLKPPATKVNILLVVDTFLVMTDLQTVILLIY